MVGLQEKAEARKASLILGVGSPFGTDRLGWMAVEALRSRLQCRDVCFETCDRPGARLLSVMRGYHHVVLIDALVGNVPPGSIHRLCKEQLKKASRAAVHGFGVADALALAHVLGELPERVTIYGIGCGSDETLPVVDWDVLAREVGEALAVNRRESDYS